MTTPRKCIYAVEKSWKYTWMKPIGQGLSDGIEELCFTRKRSDQVAVCSNTTKYGRMWCCMTPHELFKIAVKNRGIEEIIVPDEKRKVYFDVEKYGDEPNTLKDAKGAISAQFPNCNFQVSGSIGEVIKKDEKTKKRAKMAKHSYHIILSNYYLESHDAATRTLLVFSKLHEKTLGFDPSVYSKRRHFKTINQGKGDGRIQAWVEGSKSVSKHLVQHDFDEDAIDASQLTYNFSENLVIPDGRKATLKLDLLDIPQLDMTCPDNFDWYDASVEKKLGIIPCYPAGHIYCLDHSVVWRICHWCKTNGLEFKHFWSWCMRREDSVHAMEKWQTEWDRQTEYKISDLTVQIIAGRFIPAVLERQSTRLLRRRFHIHPTKTIKSEFYTWTDINPNIKVTLLSGPMGKGKTETVIDYGTKMPKSFDTRILWLTPSVTLTENTFQRLLDAGFDVACYRNHTASEKRAGVLESKNFALDSVQSLHYLEKDYNLVIIDEIEKMLCTFDGKAKTHRCEDTGQDRLRQNWAKLKSVIHRAKKVIAMDAFTTKTTIELFENIEKEHSAIESYLGKQIEIVDISTPPSPRFFTQYETKYDLIAKMCDSLDKGKKLFIFTPWASEKENSVNQLAAFLRGKYNWTDGREVLSYWSKAVADKKKLARCEEVWGNPDVRCVITNSCITVGVNFNRRDVFDEIFCFYHSMIGARDFIQVLYRPRHPVSNVMHIHLEKGIFPDTFLDDLEYPTCKTFQVLRNGVQIEKSANKCTENFDTLHMFMEKANIRFVGEVQKASKKARAEVKAMCEETDLVFAWGKIPVIENSGDADELRAKVLNGSATTEDVLRLDKFWFSKLFLKDTPDKDLALVWMYSPNFPMLFTTLYKNPNHIIRRVMAECKMDAWSDSFPNMPKTAIPIHEINKQFKFHNPVSVNSASTVPRMVNAYWCKRVLVSQKHDTRAEYETNENYLICMGIVAGRLSVRYDDVCR